MQANEERLEIEVKRFTRLCNPFGSLDVREAVRFGLEFGISADKIIDLAEQFSRDTGIYFYKLDIVYIVYEHVRQAARCRIYEATGDDFFNDDPGEIYTYANCMATCYDYTEEARERLLNKLSALDRTEREEFLNEDTLRFLEYIGISQAEIEENSERLKAAIVSCW